MAELNKSASDSMPSATSAWECPATPVTIFAAASRALATIPTKVTRRLRWRRVCGMGPVLPNLSGTEAWNEFLRKVGQASRLPGARLATLPKPVLEAGRPPRLLWGQDRLGRRCQG